MLKELKDPQGVKVFRGLKVHKRSDHLVDRGLKGTLVTKVITLRAHLQDHKVRKEVLGQQGHKDKVVDQEPKGFKALKELREERVEQVLLDLHLTQG